jgi:hypothetical protein
MSEIKVNKISPATSTDITLGDSGDTFTLPSGATFVNSGTATGFGGGKIGQVVTVQNTAVESSTSTSYATIADLSVAITPTATDSKIWVVSSLQLSRLNDHTKYQLFRDSTAIGEGDADGSRTQASFSAYEGGLAEGYACFPNAFTWLDSPSTTSEVAYTWKWLTTGGTLYLNRSEDDSDHSNYARCASSITVMEVLA